MSAGVAAASDLVRGSGDATDAPGLWRRLVRRPLAVIAAGFLLLLVGVAIVAPIAMPWVEGETVGNLLAVHQGPSWQHLLGTDTVGRDVLERLLVGTRQTLVDVAYAVLVGTLLGVPLGLAAGYFGGSWFDRVVGWVTDLSFALPGLIIILVVVSVFPSSMFAAMVTLGILSAPGIARLVRAVVLPVREEPYVAAAQVSGLSRPYIIRRHVLPRVMGVVIVQTALFAAGTVGIEAGLVFLGAAGSATAPSWGGMFADGLNVLLLDPWLIWPPAIAIGLTVLALTVLGDVVRDANADRWSAPVNRRRGRRRPAPSPEKSGLRAPRQPARPMPSPDAGRAPARGSSLLSVEHISVAFESPSGPVTAVEDVSFDLAEGEAVGIVGESGCGKTMTAMAVLGLLPGSGKVSAGRIQFAGRELTAISERELGRMRGKDIGLISQEPLVSLTPTYRVGWQIAEVVRRHHRVSRRAARARTVELLRQVHLPDPEGVARRYVHELSGGMAQRVALARALAGEPQLLIADEPTTALDVTIQAEILDLLRELQQDRGMAILLITHDWGVIADVCSRVLVMYAGQIVEQAATAPIFHQPLHPYMQALLASSLHQATDADVLPTIPGAVPTPGAWPPGCHFHPRCAYATSDCRETVIALEEVGEGHATRCIHSEALLAASPNGASHAADLA